MTLENSTSLSWSYDGIRTPEQRDQQQADWASIQKIRDNINELFRDNSSGMDFSLNTESIFRTLVVNKIGLPHMILKTRGETTHIQIRYEQSKNGWVGSRGRREQEIKPESWSFGLNSNSGIGSNQASYEFMISEDEPMFPQVTEELNGNVVRSGIYTPSDIGFVEILTRSILESYKSGLIKHTFNRQAHRPE